MGIARQSRWVVMTVLLVAGMLAPARAGASVLYDQTTGSANVPIQSAHRDPPDSHDSDAADDFTVPPGVLWKITSVDVVGQELTPDPTSVLLFANGGAGPGSLLFRQGGIPFPAGAPGSLIVSGTPPLPPGHYWLSVYTTYSGAPFDWRSQAPVTGMPAVWENPEDGSGSGCKTFTPLSQCAPGIGGDLMFRINGDALRFTPKRKCKKRRHRHQAATAKKKRCKKRRR